MLKSDLKKVVDADQFDALWLSLLLKSLQCWPNIHNRLVDIRYQVVAKVPYTVTVVFMLELIWNESKLDE